MGCYSALLKLFRCLMANEEAKRTPKAAPKATCLAAKDRDLWHQQHAWLSSGCQKRMGKR